LAAQLRPKATIKAVVLAAGSKGSNGVVGSKRSKIAIMVHRPALTVQGSRDGGGSRNDAG
jgi:hypothetical protein